MRPALLLVALLGCKGKHAAIDAAPPPPVVADAATGDPAWRALDGFPHAQPRWHVTGIQDPLALARDAHGPIVIDNVAIVAASGIGAMGVDLAKGEILYQRAQGSHVALPVPLAINELLTVGDCPAPVDVPKGAALIGCYAVLSVRNPAAFGAGSLIASQADADALGGGPTTLAVTGTTAYLGRSDGWVRWEVGDPPRGEARATAVARREVPRTGPSVSVGEGDERVELWAEDDVLELRYHDPAMVSDRSAIKDVSSAPGALGLVPDDPRAVRAFRLPQGEATIQPIVVHVDGLELRQLGAAMPGISLLAAAHGARGYAMALRLDASLQHDYVAAVTADGQVAWVYELPAPPNGGRAQPVGLAMTDELVVVFHDAVAVAALPAP